MEYVLTTSNIIKNYRKFIALDDVSINIPKGAIYGLVGKNGAGKTTLMRVICGLQAPSKGTYSIYGVDYKDKKISKSRNRMSALIERPALYTNMSARDNLIQQCIMKGIPTYEDIPKILKQVGLENIGNKKVHTFSLGNKQRLGIALTLIGNPDFILLDEPINGLDPQAIIELRELILKLNKEYQITFLISSHILNELSRLATHYGFIHKGQLIKEISAEELENTCKKSINVTVTSTVTLARVLETMGYEYEILSDTTANIYGTINISQLVFALSSENCELINSHEQDESLENYFLNLIGGK